VIYAVIFGGRVGRQWTR